MSALAKLMDDTAADPLRYARLHAGRGGRVIGLVGADVPAELVLAADALPVTLPAMADGATEAADRYLEPSFMPSLRSIVDQWLRGAFDFMEAVVFSRSDDSAQRCYYYLCELQRDGSARGPRPFIFDIAKIPRATSLAHTEAAARTLAAALTSRLERLPAAIAARDERRALFHRLDLLRQSHSPPAGPLCAKLLRLGDAVPAERFDKGLAAWLDRGFAPHSGPRVLLAGSVPPDERLHIAIERAGGCVVAEVGDHALDRLGPPIGPAPDPLHALARHYHVLDHGPRSFADRAALLVRRVAQSRADGVVAWLIEQDEATGWQLPAMARVLATAGVPLLSLTRRRWDAQDGALEELATFTRGLGVHT